MSANPIWDLVEVFTFMLNIHFAVVYVCQGTDIWIPVLKSWGESIRLDTERFSSLNLVYISQCDEDGYFFFLRFCNKRMLLSCHLISMVVCSTTMATYFGSPAEIVSYIGWAHEIFWEWKELYIRRTWFSKNWNSFHQIANSTLYSFSASIEDHDVGWVLGGL